MAAAFNRRHFSDGRRPFLGDQNFNGYRATGAGNATEGQDLVTLSQVQALIAAVQGVPTGAIIPLTGMTVPAGWLLLNGQLVSRTTYAALYAFALASGNMAATEAGRTAGQFGPGDGSTTFGIPNLTVDGGHFVRPLASGRTIGTVQADDLKGHTHTGFATSAGAHGHEYNRAVNGTIFNGAQSSTGASVVDIGVTAQAGQHEHVLSINATGGTETRPKNIAYPVIIKT